MNIISTASGTTAAKPGYFSSFKIRTRISAGFAVVLVLLAGLGIASTLGIRGLSQNFDAYANVSDETVAGALIDGDVNDIRDNVRLFANTGEKSIAEDVNKHYDKIMKSIADMLAVTRSPQRLKMFQEIEENLRSYFKNFATLVELRTQYGSTTTRMNDTAARASKAIKAADVAADETKSVETANQTMEMVEDFLEARVSA
jgi:CHASE3 domain sensor protein